MHVDVAVIGGGTAGLAAYRAARREGARTVLINAGPWGTTCVRVGCMPSKLLLAAGRAAREAKRAETFGVRMSSLEVDGRAVMQRVRAIRDRLLRSLLDGMDDIPEVDRIEGHARFTGPTRLQVEDGPVLDARAVVIATGSRPAIPRMLEPVRDRVVTNDSIFELADLPSSLAVVGAGALGIELAVAMARLGVRVCVLDEGGRIGGLKDEHVSGAAAALLGAEVDLQLDVEVDASAVPDGVRLTWTGKAGSGEGTFERVLAAAGRPPVLEGLDLEAAGLALDDHGVPRHDRATLRCGESAVFIAGDAAHDLPVLHEASRQGELAGRNAARLPELERNEPPIALAMVFSDPDMATIGRSLEALGQDAAVGCCDFDAGRGLLEDRPGGLMRLYARRSTGVIAGGEMVGPAVEHLAQFTAVLVQQEMTPADALRLPFYHPTFEEGLKDCLRDLARQLQG